MTESFPRQRALTRSFRLGVPRNFRLNADREIILFIRSESGRSAAGDLWCAQPSHDSETQSPGWIERKLVSSSALAGTGEIPEQELARRERMREVTEGITTFSVDQDFTRTAFVVDGEIYVMELPETVTAPLATAEHIETQGSCIDPQISPDGKFVAYVKDGGMNLVNLANKNISPLCGPAESDENVTWGLADFAASEELDRMRGYWWSADSLSIFVERVDESNVEIAWIADPANPTREARPHRYPFAGTNNALVSLFEVDLSGNAQELVWDHDAFPYLVTVNTSGARATVSVLSRDQRDIQVHELHNSKLQELVTHHEAPWHTVFSGVPRLNDSGELIEIQPVDGAFRLCINGKPVSPPEVQVNGLIACSDRVIYSGCIDSTSQSVFSLSGGSLTTASGMHSAAVDGSLAVMASTALESTTTLHQLVNLDRSETVLHTFTNNSEIPHIEPQVTLTVTGEQELRSAIIWPENHTPGTKIPVICAPYGGPHFQRVIQSGLAFCSDQWLANFGFAVVVTDNRGTPSRGPAFEYAIHQDLATKVLDDQIETLAALGQSYPDLDLSRVGIHGWSFGGYLAALAVLERSDFFHAAVAGAPVTDWSLYDTAYTERYLGMPQDNPEAYEKTSLINKVRGLGSPLLIIHGLADDNVLVAHTLRLSSALLAAGKKHSVLPLSGVTHMTPQEIVAENLMLAELDFFQQHLQRS